ncbi:membrane protein [Nocardiopsis terrae]|uniref:Permease n=1 Tax=Nocardiopsis terrae TaxID=372655 RepID=A0ABR9HA45_9ACTN|nr:AEC family transporter [Nocardiopsis terrae]MBE1455904.1 putative permease [Nocardiopsis terrae]GHC98442.1 membrane protein [Nocardiopsis terrae]
MSGVIVGFGVIASVVVIGYMLGRIPLLGPGTREVLSRLAFYVASPALLFTILARTDLSILVSDRVLVSVLSVVAVALVFLTAGILRRWGVGRTTVGLLGSSYVNAGNLGIPISVYVLGDATLVAPVLLFQLLVLAPVSLTVLDLNNGGVRGFWPVLRRSLGTPVRNPVVIASVAGVAVSASGWAPPAPFMEPFELVGGMAVPAMLLAFGISLHGSSVPGRGGPEQVPVLLAVALKSAGQPLAAWALGSLVFGLAGADLFSVVVLAALPTAQNVFNYATQYRTGETLVREVVLLTTLLTVPALFAITFLLG